MRSLALLLAAAMALSGCAFVPDAEFSALKDSLTLTIADAKRSATSGRVDFGFKLANRGATAAKACLGPSRAVFYEVGSSGGVSSTFVDHPGCEREFTIPPGDAMSWSETLEVPRLDEGRVQVEVRVQIVNPRRCGGWGDCAAFDLKSSSVGIP